MVKPAVLELHKTYRSLNYFTHFV